MLAHCSLLVPVQLQLVPVQYVYCDDIDDDEVYFRRKEKMWGDAEDTGRLAQNRIQHRAKRKVGRVARNTLRSPSTETLYVAR